MGRSALPRWWPRRLLSPLLSSLTRCPRSAVSFAIYPTFVTPSRQRNLRKQDSLFEPVVLGTELGLDLQRPLNSRCWPPETAAHPPEELTLRYQATTTSAFQARSTPKAAWQTSAGKLFFRFLDDSPPS